MRHSYILLLLFLLNACASVKNHDKIQEINNPVKNQQDTLTIISPFILRGGIGEAAVIQKIRDSFLFGVHVPPDKYQRNTAAENSMRQYSLNVYKEYFKNHIPVNIVKLTDQDTSVLEKEISSMEESLRDSSLVHNELSPAIQKIFSKYSGNFFLLTDMKEYYDKDFFQTHTTVSHDWATYRIFIIDIKQKKIVFYKYIHSAAVRFFSTPRFLPFEIKKPLKSFYKW